MRLVFRETAIKKGLSTYFDGKTCKRGHISERRVDSYGCVECAKKVSTKWSKKNKKRTREIQKNYRQRNLAVLAARRAAYYIKNKHVLRAYTKEWVEKNRDRVRMHVRNRRARLAFGKLSPNIETVLRKKQRGKCVFCRERLRKDAHLDHIMPLALGGPNTDDNVQMLCRSCNQKKCAKHPIKFMQEQGLLQ